MSNYYTDLAISSNPSTAEIKKSYHKISLKFHPDKNPNNNEAKDRFQKSNEAYEVLSNAETRGLYDQYCSKFGHENFVQNYKLGIGIIKDHLRIQKNYYDVLNVDENADKEQIKAATKRLLNSHPSSDNKSVIREAAQILTDPKKRSFTISLGMKNLKKSLVEKKK
jgi:DnaJ-class molecular chaperone